MAFFEPHDDDVKHGGKEETEPGDSEHSEKDGRAESLPHFRTGAGAKNKRKDTKNESKGSHKNRAQSKSAGFDGGGEAVFLISILDLLRELNDQDGVLAGKPNEHNETDLREDIILHRAQPDTVDRAEQTHWDDENDGEWQRPAFV